MLTKAVGKSLLSKLAKVDFKPRYSVSGKGLQNTIHHQETFSKKFQISQEKTGSKLLSWIWN